MRHGGRYPVLFRSCDPASREQYGCSLCCFLLCFRTDILSSQYSSCHNVPPRIAHPDLPHLPALPSEVDPDRWVDHLHGRAYVRHVGADGCVTVDERSYYVGLQHKGKLVALLVNAPGRCFEVWEGRSLLKRLPIKGLQGAPMPLERFIAWMREQAIAEERRGKFQTRAFGWRQLLLWDNASA